jgi:hypothetical protein
VRLAGTGGKQQRRAQVGLKHPRYLDQLQDGQPLRAAFEVRDDLLIPTEAGAATSLRTLLLS